MSKSLPLMFALLMGLLVLACSRAADTNRNNTAATNRSTGEQIGIPECDNFITAYEDCVSSKVPESSRTHLRASVTTWRTDWKRLANNPETRANLAAACKTQRNAVAQQMKAYGCTF